MKKTYLYSCITLAAALVSCSQDDFVSGYQSGDGNTLKVTVTDNGYTGSRAKENGLTTEFTAGDRIGLFLVQNGKIANEVNNLCLSASDNGDGSISWTTDGAALPDVPEATYFAYYPYTENLPAEVDATATDSKDFFAPVIAAWDVKTDQSDYADYTASDLMTASAVAEDGKLTFPMEHRMSLVIVTFPSKRYVFTNEPAIPDYVLLSVDNPTFNGITPRQVQLGKYAFLANPTVSQERFSGTYHNGEAERKWEFTAELKPGTAVTYNIDHDKNKGEISHNLQVGDFFLSDGSLLSKDAPESEVANADVIGIVYCIDPSRIGETEKEALGGIAHGLVMSTRQVSNAKYSVFAWGPLASNETEIGMVDLCGTTQSETFENAEKNLSGLYVMNLVREKHPEEYTSEVYEVFKATAEFGSGEKNYSNLQRITTCWYVPTLGQWIDIVRNLGQTTLTATEDFKTGIYPHMFYWINRGMVMTNINNSMAKVNSNSKNEFASNTWIWTSSITHDEWTFNVELAFNVNVTDGEGGLNSFSCFPARKTAFNVVYGVLAF